MTHNLDEQTAESFEFILGGNTYQMRYPTTEEIEEIQKIKSEEEQGSKLFEFITPVTEGAPPVMEALKKKNIKVLSHFNQMIKEEMGV